MEGEFPNEIKYMNEVNTNIYFKDIMNTRYNNSLKIYTDGSKDQEKQLQ